MPTSTLGDLRVEVGAVPLPQLIVTITSIALVAFFWFIHKMTSGKVYRRWVPFLVSTFDFSALLFIAIWYINSKITGMNETILVLIFILFFMLLIVFNALRHGNAIIFYNTALGQGA